MLSTCQAVWTYLKDDCKYNPSLKQMEVIAAGFENKANTPRCVGAVDGKHIRVISLEEWFFIL